MTHVTCRLTAKNRDQLRNPTLGNRVWATCTFNYFTYLNCRLLGITAGMLTGSFSLLGEYFISLEVCFIRTSIDLYNNNHDASHNSGISFTKSNNVNVGLDILPRINLPIRRYFFGYVG